MPLGTRPTFDGLDSLGALREGLDSEDKKSLSSPSNWGYAERICLPGSPSAGRLWARLGRMAGWQDGRPRGAGQTGKPRTRKNDEIACRRCRTQIHTSHERTRSRRWLTRSDWACAMYVLTRDHVLISLVAGRCDKSRRLSWAAGRHDQDMAPETFPSSGLRNQPRSRSEG